MACCYVIWRASGINNMKTLFNAFLFVSFIAAVPTVATAQWPAYPTPAPRTPDGKPNLEGPTPTTADGKPDFSGIWGRAGGQGGAGGQRGAAGDGQRGQGAQQGAAPAPEGRGGQRGGAAAGPPPVPPLPPDGIPIATFGNAGQGFKDDLPFQPSALELMKQ